MSITPFRKQMSIHDGGSRRHNNLALWKGRWKVQSSRLMLAEGCPPFAQRVVVVGSLSQCLLKSLATMACDRIVVYKSISALVSMSDWKDRCSRHCISRIIFVQQLAFIPPIWYLIERSRDKCSRKSNCYRIYHEKIIITIIMSLRNVKNHSKVNSSPIHSRIVLPSRDL